MKVAGGRCVGGNDFHAAVGSVTRAFSLLAKVVSDGVGVLLVELSHKEVKSSVFRNYKSGHVSWI